jgi:phosphoglycolate phosphatase
MQQEPSGVNVPKMEHGRFSRKLFADHSEVLLAIVRWSRKRIVAIVYAMKQDKKDERSGRRQAVIFDFDGTIADSFDYVFEFLKSEARNSTHYNAAELEKLRKMSMKDLALHLGVPFWRLPFIYFKGRRVMREHMERVQPFDGMVEVIRKLHGDGYLLLIASANSSTNIHHLLRRQGVLGCFRAIRSSSGITGKPGLIRQLIVRYRLPRLTTWYVGDEAGDVTAARAAGVRSMAVSWGFADPERLSQMRPDALANKPADIISIIEAKWKK